MRSILVTGGAGFIGSHFVRAFMRRHRESDVHVLDALTYAGDLDNLPPNIVDHPQFHFWYGNVCDVELVGEIMQKVDTVIHFAAESHVARSIASNRKFYETDVMGTQVVASQVLKYHRRIKRFVHISTSEVYGTALTEPMAEDHPLMPNSPYASAKCGADRLAYSYWRTYGIPAVIIRPFNQYGPSQHLEKCIPRFITSALTNRLITLHGDGTAARDWCYVTDTCQAFLAVLEVPLDAVVGEVINLGTDMTIERIMEQMKEGSPDILGMSALLTTTMVYMKEVVDALKEAGRREEIKVIIGGAPITQAYADEIGADGYAPDAASAVDLVKDLLGLQN